MQSLTLFGPRHIAERNPLASPLMLAALARLQPCEAPRRIGELLRIGRVADAVEIAETLIAEGDHP